MDRIFIVWGREVELSRYLAKGLNAELKQVYVKKWRGVKLPALIRYLVQGVKTLVILGQLKPRVVIVQNPPIFAALISYFYCTLAGAKLAIDSHTAAFLDRKWILFHWLSRLVARRAILNTCHNYKNLATLEKWGVKPAMVVQFYNPIYEEEQIKQSLADKRVEELLTDSKLPIMMVNRFAGDDNWQSVLETATIFPEANFFITGGASERLMKKIRQKAPANVCLTGYLPHLEFLKLMNRCRVVLAFTLRPDTVLWSIREIMALKKPFVTTDSEVLRRYFGEVAVFSGPKQEDIKENITLALEGEEEVKNKIERFLIKDRKRWEEEILTANNILNS